MTVQYDKLYEGKGKQEFSLACGMISTTVIYFKEVNLLVKIEAEGELFFYNTQGERLATCSLPRQERRYNEVNCTLKDGEILFEFTLYTYVDNYPHCDGEYDRWEEIRAGSLNVRYDLDKKTVAF